jgi:thiosulfate/3-mercaptopyruvate sulfurtransferase
MKKSLVFITIICLAGMDSLAKENVIVTPQWLKEHQKDADMVIIYTGFAVKSDFEREHIEGSVFLWPDLLAGDTQESTMNAPDINTATKILQELGINKDSKVVIYHKGMDVTIAARMFATMEHLGLAGKTYFLNGGIEAWKRAGFPVVSGAVTPKKGNYVAVIDPKLVDKNYVTKALQTNQSFVVDARMKRYYDGDPVGNPRDGHITGALNLPFPDMLDSLNQFKSIDQNRSSFQAVITDPNKEVVLYCFIGQTACVDYVVGRALGYRMKVYDGSMQEWSRDPNLPMSKNK